MAIKLSPSMRDAVFYALAEGSNALTQLDLYTAGHDGTIPPDANAGTTGTLVAQIVLVWQHTTSGTAYVSGGGTANKAGTLGYGRLSDSTRTYMIQGSAGTAIEADFVTDKQIMPISGPVTKAPISFVGHIVQPAEA